MEHCDTTTNPQATFVSLNPAERQFVLGLLRVLASDQESAADCSPTEYEKDG